MIQTHTDITHKHKQTRHSMRGRRGVEWLSTSQDLNRTTLELGQRETMEEMNSVAGGFGGERTSEVLFEHKVNYRALSKTLTPPLHIDRVISSFTTLKA